VPPRVSVEFHRPSQCPFPSVEIAALTSSPIRCRQCVPNGAVHIAALPYCVKPGCHCPPSRRPDRRWIPTHHPLAVAVSDQRRRNHPRHRLPHSG
jgi:hypothetical protein